MHTARTSAFLAAGLLVALGGCTSTTPCCGICPADQRAVFKLACGSPDLKTVVATGPCAMPDASPSSYVGSNGSVFIQSQSPGVCHVELTFATGFTYSADVTFASQSGSVCGGAQCKCGDYLAPTSGPFTVDNPSSACMGERRVDQ